MPELAAFGPRMPMLGAEQVLFFANDNVEPFERQVIEDPVLPRSGWRKLPPILQAAEPW